MAMTSVESTSEVQAPQDLGTSLFGEIARSGTTYIQINAVDWEEGIAP